MGNRNRTIELSTVPVRGPIARRGGGGIIPFGSASTTLYLLCPTGHARYMKTLPQSSEAFNDHPIRYDQPFALPGVKKRRLFEDKTARSSCALDQQGKRAADGPGPDRMVVGGGIMPFSYVVACHVSYKKVIRDPQFWIPHGSEIF